MMHDISKSYAVLWTWWWVSFRLSSYLILVFVVAMFSNPRLKLQSFCWRLRQTRMHRTRYEAKIRDLQLDFEFVANLLREDYACGTIRSTEDFVDLRALKKPAQNCSMCFIESHFDIFESMVAFLPVYRSNSQILTSPTPWCQLPDHGMSHYSTMIFSAYLLAERPNSVAWCCGKGRGEANQGALWIHVRYIHFRRHLNVLF